jgi:hypothetical protein
VFRNTKKQGDYGLAMAVATFAALGYTVSVPLTDSQDYDLVIDFGERLARVQVKTTPYIRNGHYGVSLSVKGGNRTSVGTVRYFSGEKVDYVFVLTGSGDKYLLPAASIRCKSSINLCATYDQYRLDVGNPLGVDAAQ